MIGGVVDVELARHQWAEGRRAVERVRADRAAYQQLSVRVDVVADALTRRIGQVFTLSELADEYGSADRWALEALHDAFPDNLPAEVSTVANAAFDLYSRRASDYSP
jgi:hypothetical protein